MTMPVYLIARCRRCGKRLCGVLIIHDWDEVEL